MTMMDPDAAYNWHDQHVSWREAKAAFVLAVTLGLGLLLLF